MSEQMIHVLLLDDEESLRKHLSAYLRDTHGLVVDSVADGNAAIRLIEEKEGRYDVALLDEVLPEGPSGLEVLQAIKAKYPDIEVILFTGWGRQAGMEALRAGAYRYLTKLVDKDELAMTIRFAAEQKRLRRERDYMAALVKASQALTRTSNIDEQLNLVWDFVREHFAAPTFFVALYDPQADTLHFPLRYDRGESDPIPTLRLGADQSNWGLAGYVVKTGQEQVWFTREQIEKEWQVLGLKPRVGPEGPSGSGICIPLQVGTKILGALSVQGYAPYAFDQALLNAVRALANQVAVALEKSRLFALAEQEARSAELQANKLKALQNLAVAISSSLDLNEILTGTCKAAVELSGADHSGLVVFDNDLSKGKVVAEYPAGDEGIRANRGAVIQVRGVPIQEQLVHKGKIINVRDLAGETRFGPVREMLLDLGIRSLLVVPIILDDKVVASFSLDSVQERAFQPYEIEICDALAKQVAVAFGNAQLFQETRAGREKLRTLYTASNMLISSQEPYQVLQAVVEQIHVAASAAWVNIILISESGRAQSWITAGTNLTLDLESLIRPDGNSIQVMRTGKPVIIEDANQQRDRVNPGMLKNGIGAALCLPLTLRAKQIGVMWIHYAEPHHFSTSEVDDLQLYVNQAAIAYDDARRMDELEHLRAAADAMASVTEPKEVLRQIVKSAREILDADYSLIWSYDPIRNLFFPEELLAENIPEQMLETLRQEEPKPGKTTGHILNTGYVIIEDLSSTVPNFLGEPTRTFLKALGVRSFQGIRLDVCGEPLGVLYVDYKTSRGFGTEERKTLEYLANHASLALKKARLLDEVTRSRQAARVVAQVSTLGKLEGTLEAIVEGALDALRCDLATVYTFDETRQQFARAEGVGYTNPANIRPPDEVTRKNPQKSALWKIVGLGPPYYHVADKAQTDGILTGRFVKAERVESGLSVQLRFGRQRVGVLFVNYRTPHRFTDDEIQDALQFANQAAVAIRNAQSYQAEQQYTQALKTIQITSAEVNAALELNVILPKLVNNAANLFAAPAINLMLLDEHRESLIIRAAVGLSEEYQEKQKIPRSRVDAIIADKGLGPHIFDLRSAPIGDTKLLESERLYNVLVAPLMIGDELTGILNIYSKDKPRSFESQEMNLAKIFANHAAIAIHNAQRYEVLQKTRETLAARTALAWTGMIGSTWRHTVEKHALTIREQIQLLRQDSTHLQKIDSLKGRLDRIERLANQILEKPLTPPLSAEEGAVSLRINDFCRERTRQLWAHEPHKSVPLELDLKLENSAAVRTSPEWLRRAFDILIDNAVEATAGVSGRKIVIGSQRRDNYAEISITDNGRGIPTEVLERLFREPIKKSQDAKGQGIGLLLAQTIVQTYGGGISCRETGPAGTTMVVSLPLGS